MNKEIQKIKNAITRRFPFLMVEVSEDNNSFGIRVIVSFRYFSNGKDRWAYWAQIKSEYDPCFKIWIDQYLKRLSYTLSIENLINENKQNGTSKTIQKAKEVCKKRSHENL